MSGVPLKKVADPQGVEWPLRDDLRKIPFFRPCNSLVLDLVTCSLTCTLSHKLRPGNINHSFVVEYGGMCLVTLEQTLYNAFVKSEVHTRRKTVGWEYSECGPSSLRAKKRRKEPQQPSSLHLRETESSVGAGRVWENTKNRGTEEGGGATRWGRRE